MHKESPLRTLCVATGVCVVCSIVVASAAVGLRPLQERNKVWDKKHNILVAAGLAEPGEAVDVDALFAGISTRTVDLETGEFLDREASGGADDRHASPPQESAEPASAEDQPVSIQHREVYLVCHDDDIQRIVLPVEGKGLWSTMHGLVALAADGTTIEQFLIYEHGETPGLGGEVDNPRWQQLWIGKRICDSRGALRIEVVKGAVEPDSPDVAFQVDGLSGATITGRGVTKMLHFWLGEDGYGPLLDRIRGGNADD